MKHWLNYFEQNRENRHVIPWKDDVSITPHIVQPFIRSLQRFQIGESGEGRHLRAAANATGDLDYIKAIDLFIKEEQEHARLMAEILKRLNAPLLTSHWSDGCFILLRRLFGLNEELMVLLVPEIIAKRYFRVLHDSIADESVKAMCGQILHDEEGHVAFHIEFLRRAFSEKSLASRAMLRAGWRILFRLSVAVVLLDHRSLLNACGVPARNFWWDCELMFDDVSAQIFAFASSRMAPLNAARASAQTS
ncbi:MAG TPA: ferritin-like domain-containing protein [Methylomirabilota bacterium]|nr:ferritin-like domain-containing protein [Methylomirabilota bacterium]